MGLRRAKDVEDMNAFEALCLQIETPLYSYALKLLQDPDDAEDVAQEALMRLFRAMQARQLKQSPRAYAFSIAHNLCMDRHRNRHSAALMAERIVPLHPQPPCTPAEYAERRLLRGEIDKALQDLPADQRAALLLREFGELSYEEIAATLGASTAQIRVWLFRARKKLAVLLDRDGQYIGKSLHGH